MFTDYSDSLLAQTGHLSIRNPIKVEDAYKLINEGQMTSLLISVDTPSLDDSKIIKTNLMGPGIKNHPRTLIYHEGKIVKSAKLTELIQKNNLESWRKYEKSNNATQFHGDFVLHYEYHQRNEVDYSSVGYFSDEEYSEEEDDEYYYDDPEYYSEEECYYPEEEMDPRDLAGDYDGEEYCYSEE